MKKVNPTQSDSANEVVPTLVGLKEFAEIMGWEKARLSTKYARQKEGKKVRPRLPEPVQVLAATPIWTVKQAEEYKGFYNRYKNN